MAKQYYKWTEKEVEYLKEHYPTTSAAEIGKALYRSKDSIRNKACQLGLKSEQRKGNNRGSFKKGNIPWNKGLKNVTGFSSTRFKKGIVPHNTRKLHEVWVRNEKGGKCKFTKTERGVERLSHYVYRKYHNKEVPKGYIIRYKDGDPMNCDITNLMCISRAENVKLNANRKKASRTRIINEAGGYLNAVLMCKI